MSRDPDYHPDVPGTRSEMVVPLLEGGAAVGAIDFQSERAGAFDLDDVAAAEKPWPSSWWWPCATRVSSRRPGERRGREGLAAYQASRAKTAAKWALTRPITSSIGDLSAEEALQARDPAVPDAAGDDQAEGREVGRRR